MVSEVLLHCSTVASCSSKMIASSPGNIKASEPPCNLTSSTAKVSRGNQRLFASHVVSRKPVCSRDIALWPKQEHLINQKNSNAHQQSSSLDRWMEDCVCDIVRNINEAPFLHMLYDPKDSTTTMTSQRQRVPAGNDLSTEERWNEVKDRVSRTSPDGVILVHHLEDEFMEGCPLGDGSSMEAEKNGDGDGDGDGDEENGCSSGTNVWGVLVLGKTIARSACYILKTTSVASSFGTCTRFCLTKASCFGGSWHDQMQSSWLLGTNNHQHNR